MNHTSTNSDKANTISMTLKLTHVAIRVKNIEASMTFYRQYLGLEIVSQRKESKTRVAWLGNSEKMGNLVLVLLELPHEVCDQPSFDHLGFSLPSREEVDKMAKKAKANGELRFGPKEMGPVAKYLCIVVDPDGNGIEFSFGQNVEQVILSHIPETEPT